MQEVTLADGSGKLQLRCGCIRQIANDGEVQGYWTPDDKYFKVVLRYFDAVPIDLAVIVESLADLNKKYGSSPIQSLNFNMKESVPQLGEWFGTVTCNDGDTRMFKVVPDQTNDSRPTLTFRSHRRRLLHLAALNH